MVDKQIATGRTSTTQTDRHTGRPDRETNQIDTQKPAAMLSRQSDSSQTDITDIQTGSGDPNSKNKQTEKTGRQTRQTDQTDTERQRQTDRQIDKQKEKQTYRLVQGGPNKHKRQIDRDREARQTRQRDRQTRHTEHTDRQKPPAMLNMMPIMAQVVITAVVTLPGQITVVVLKAACDHRCGHIARLGQIPRQKQVTLSQEAGGHRSGSPCLSMGVFTVSRSRNMLQTCVSAQRARAEP